MPDEPGADRSSDDPFDGWVLDDEFVKGAFRTEHSAEERIERMQRLDADLRRKPEGAERKATRRGSRPRSGGGRLSRVTAPVRRQVARVPFWVWLFLAIAILVAVVELTSG